MCPVLLIPLLRTFLFMQGQTGELVMKMKTKTKSNRLKLYIVEKIAEIFKLMGDLCVVIVTVELLFGFPVDDGKPIDVERLLYLICFSYFIAAVTTYIKIKLNRKF